MLAYVVNYNKIRLEGSQSMFSFTSNNLNPKTFVNTHFFESVVFEIKPY